MSAAFSPRPPKFIGVPIPRLLGLNEDENPAALRPGELTIALNSYRRGQMRGTRPGCLRDPDVYTASMTGPIQGIVEFPRSNGAAKSRVVVENGVVKAATAGNLNGALTFNTSALWCFAQDADVIYGAGGTLDDDFWYWDGSAGSIVAVPILSLAATAIYPSYAFPKWNRLWTCRFRDGSGAISTDLSSNPMVYRYSGLRLPLVWPTGNTIGGTGIGGLPAYGNEWATGYGEFTDGTGDWLLLLTNRRLYAVSQTGDSLAPFAVSERSAIANGCVSQRAFVSLGLDSGDAVYLSHRGIHSLRQSQEFGGVEKTFLSWKIRRTFATLNQSAIEASVGAYDPRLGIVVFWVPTGSSTSPDLGLVLDVKDKSNLTAENAEWDFWTLGTTGNDALVTALASGTDSNGSPFIYLGNKGGDVGRFDPDSGADFGSGYHVQMRLKHEDYGLFSQSKQVGNWFVNLQPGGNYMPRARILYDYGTRGTGSYSLPMPLTGDLLGSTFILGTSLLAPEEITVQSKQYGEGAGQTISFEFEHNSPDEPFYVGTVSPEISIFGAQWPGAGAGSE